PRASSLHGEPRRRRPRHRSRDQPDARLLPRQPHVAAGIHVDGAQHVGKIKHLLVREGRRSMTRAIVSYFSSLLTFVACDMVWLGLMAPRFYRPILGDSALVGVNLPPAIAFYLLYPVGLMIFAVMPALKAGSPGAAALYGALFGFFTYATYD